MGSPDYTTLIPYIIASPVVSTVAKGAFDLWREHRNRKWLVEDRDRIAADLAHAVEDQAAKVKLDLDRQTAELVAGSRERNKAIVAAVDRGVADASAAIDKSNHLTEKGHAILEQGNAVLEQVVALRKDMEQKQDKP